MLDDSLTALESLSCNNCGVPLNVSRSANFVTCNHCQTQLAIRRTPAASYTEQLAEVSRKTDELSAQVRKLAWQNELAAVDQEWEREKERHMITGKHGRRRIPAPTLALIMGGLFAGVGIGLFVVGFVSRSPGMLIGLPMVAIGVIGAVYEHIKAGDYRAARDRYLRLRAEVTPQNVNLDRFTLHFSSNESPLMDSQAEVALWSSDRPHNRR